MTFKPARFCLSASLLAAAVTIVAEAQAAAPERNPFAIAWPQTCAALINGLIQQPQLQPVLEARPIPFDVACPCIREKVQADPYISVMLTTDDQEIKERSADPRFKPYFLSKIMSSVLICTGPELQKSAESFIKEH